MFGMSVFLLILGLVLFVGLVVVHEFGHFLVARRNGVEVEEFGIGFPPTAWKKKTRTGFIFSLNWLPLGGFVKLKGEHDADKSEGSFGAATTWAKTKIMLAGVGMNLMAAYVLLLLLALIGIPQLIDNQFSIASDAHTVKREVLVGYVEPDSPAQKAGLQPRDQLISIGAVCQNCQATSEKISTSEKLPNVTKKYAGEEVSLQYARGKQILSADVKLRSAKEVSDSLKTDNPKGYLGVAPTEYAIQRYTWSAPVVAAGTIKQFTVLTFKGLGNVIADLVKGNTTQASEQVSGPVGIFVLLKNGSLLGARFVLLIVAVISLTLAIMNVLPIPALDGGRLFVMLLFKVIKKPLSQRAEEIIHGTGFALLMALFVLITVVDIKRFF